jgi:hypothetical protein
MAKQFLNGESLQVRVPFEGFIEICNVGAVVLVVVDLHGLRVNVGLERVEAIGERRELVSSALFSDRISHCCPPRKF